MKIILLFLSFLLSCSMEQELTHETNCNIGYFEVYPNNVRFIRTTEANIKFSYSNEQGIPIAGLWVDGQVNWSCIAFIRRQYQYEVVVTVADEKCVLIVPPLNNDL